ncbi:MAG: SDR family oxidoreductase [Candidatus Sumerlaeota bacterium]|nr:SDR family oxidoreductase [Candidatus Sumerlaeota bacterium]
MAAFDSAAFFDLNGKVVAVTGGGGVLCSAMAEALGAVGAKVAVLDVALGAARKVADAIVAKGGQAIAAPVNVLDKAAVERALATTLEEFGAVDALINGAGGNKAEATTSPALSFFDLPPEAVRWVFDLNCIGTIIPSQVFAREFAARKRGTILNIASMNALRPLTRIPAYSAAKAAVANFTQWLAVHLAQNYAPDIRVNALAPGFFLTQQNRFLLVDEKTGGWTPRGQTILSHTPQGRFGKPEDLIGAVLWLLSPAAEFVTGIVIPIDGGFSAFSGV